MTRVTKLPPVSWTNTHSLFFICFTYYSLEPINIWIFLDYKNHPMVFIILIAFGGFWIWRMDIKHKNKVVTFSRCLKRLNLNKCISGKSWRSREKKHKNAYVEDARDRGKNAFFIPIIVNWSARSSLLSEAYSHWHLLSEFRAIREIKKKCVSCAGRLRCYCVVFQAVNTYWLDKSKWSRWSDWAQ